MVLLSSYPLTTYDFDDDVSDGDDGGQTNSRWCCCDSDDGFCCSMMAKLITSVSTRTRPRSEQLLKRHCGREGECCTIKSGGF